MIPFFSKKIYMNTGEYLKISDDKCIAAISTGMTNSGIGIIRVSGRDSVYLVDPFLPDIDLPSCESHTIHYGHFSYKGDVLDEVMVSVFLAPRSYTKENVVEINCHGGILILNEVLNALFTNNIRPAEPGEFTKRAFLNGRIDLSQSEAVMDLINSGNDFSRRSALMHIKGNLSLKIKDLREKILHESAFIEAALDDPEHYSLDGGYCEKLKDILDQIKFELTKMIDNFSQGRVLKEGIDTIIIGKPNVGKSSLLNYLAGEELAIVTDVPGTTRDLIRQSVSFKGIPLNLIDTAGIRDSDDLVEKIGVKKSLDYISKADLIIFILDSSRKLSTEDFEIFDLLKEKSSRTITLLNKSDLENSLDLDAVPEKLKSNLITVSLKSGSGLDNLYSFISKIFFNNKVFDPEESLISNNRQLYLIKDALNSINLCLNSIDVGMTEDVFTIDLMDAYSSLGKVIGENVEDDLVDKVFSDFCMGK